MRFVAALALSLWVALGSTSAAADTFYKYRDKASGRDVFVNRLDQVPRAYRAHARIVLEGPDAEPQANPAAPSETVGTSPKAHRSTLRTVTQAAPASAELRRALGSGDPLNALPGAVGMLFDTKLAQKGAPALHANERARLARVVIAVIVASVIAGLAALVAWIVILVTAIRDGRLWWALFIFLFSPLGYVYVFVHGDKGRWLWKTLCTAGMLAPAVVGLVGAWRIYAWFAAVAAARGGRL